MSRALRKGIFTLLLLHTGLRNVKKQPLTRRRIVKSAIARDVRHSCPKNRIASYHAEAHADE
jgi:hypothetical protein